MTKLNESAVTVVNKLNKFAIELNQGSKDSKAITSDYSVTLSYNDSDGDSVRIFNDFDVYFALKEYSSLGKVKILAELHANNDIIDSELPETQTNKRMHKESEPSPSNNNSKQMLTKNGKTSANIEINKLYEQKEENVKDNTSEGMEEEVKEKRKVGRVTTKTHNTKNKEMKTLDDIATDVEAKVPKKRKMCPSKVSTTQTKVNKPTLNDSEPSLQLRNLRQKRMKTSNLKHFDLDTDETSQDDSTEYGSEEEGSEKVKDCDDSTKLQELEKKAAKAIYKKEYYTKRKLLDIEKQHLEQQLFQECEKKYLSQINLWKKNLDAEDTKGLVSVISNLAHFVD